MITKDIEKFASNLKGGILFDFAIKNFSWFNIGGKTKIFFKPNSLKELIEFLKLYSHRGKIFILGSYSLFHHILLIISSASFIDSLVPVRI